MTSYTGKILEDVRRQLAPSDRVLEVARARRRAVLDAAMTFPEARRRYNSGSIAHWTANNDLDADCGIVIDRRKFPELGPDGDDVGPTAIVQRVVGVVAPLVEGATITTSKRAITVKFNAPVEGWDPSVDLIVGLDRREKPGLWIPNLWSDSWDPSHPERHTELFLGQDTPVRRVWARAVRLAKGWNMQSIFDKPGLSSFNIEALMWMCITDEMSEAEALAELFAFGGRELVVAPTPDPAKVSPPIKLLLDDAIVVARLNDAAKLMETALDHDDDENAVREALSSLFPEYVEAPAAASGKAAMATSLREKGNAAFGIGKTGTELGAAVAGSTSVKHVRSWTDEKER
jgi:hypothetical protein